MTCREKIMYDLKRELEHPELGTRVLNTLLDNICPEAFNLLPDPTQCCQGDYSCVKCWDREIPGTSLDCGDSVKRLCESAKRAFALGQMQNVRALKEGTEAIAATIKDSGDRTEFETGAVRDMREGKGRCDLMPLEVVANFLPPEAKQTLENINNFQKTNNTVFLGICIEEFARQTRECDNHLGNVCTMLLEVAKHFEEGAKKYGENNWQKGIPVHCYIDSAVRHYLKWLRGDKDEPHDRAFVWNLMCCIWEVDYRPKEESDFLKKEPHIPKEDNHEK